MRRCRSVLLLLYRTHIFVIYRPGLHCWYGCSARSCLCGDHRFLLHPPPTLGTIDPARAIVIVLQSDRHHLHITPFSAMLQLNDVTRVQYTHRNIYLYIINISTSFKKKWKAKLSKYYYRVKYDWEQVLYYIRCCPNLHNVIDEWEEYFFFCICTYQSHTKKIYFIVWGDEKERGGSILSEKRVRPSDTNTQYKYTSNRKKEGGKYVERGHSRSWYWWTNPLPAL